MFGPSLVKFRKLFRCVYTYIIYNILQLHRMYLLGSDSRDFKGFDIPNEFACVPLVDNLESSFGCFKVSGGCVFND